MGHRSAIEIEDMAHHDGNHCRRCKRSWGRCDPRDSECTRHRYAAALQSIVDHYDARSEMYTSDADCAAALAAIARNAIS